MKNKKYIENKRRVLRMESLEERRLLSVSPLSAPSDSMQEMRAELLPTSAKQMTDAEVLAEQEELTVTTLSDTVNAYDGQISLREAINYASANDTIYFDVHGTIALQNGQLEINKALTICSENADITIDAQQKSRVIYASYASANLTIDGLTITNGYVKGESYVDVYGDTCCEAYGGGIYSEGSTLTVKNSKITYNKVEAFAKGTNAYARANADARWGGIYASGDVTVIDSTISNNTATATATGGNADANADANAGADASARANAYARGGGICAHNVTVIDSTISNNTATATATGGTAYAYDASAYADAAADAYAYAYGGGIYARGNVTVIDSTISNNTATATATGGNAYASSASSAGDSDSDASAYASAYAYGGGIYANYVYNKNSSISGNRVDAAAKRGNVGTAEAEELGPDVYGTLIHGLPDGFVMPNITNAKLTASAAALTEETAITLDASDSFNASNYYWDLDSDGVYDDATGAIITLCGANYTGSVKGTRITWETLAALGWSSLDEVEVCVKTVVSGCGMYETDYLKSSVESVKLAFDVSDVVLNTEIYARQTAYDDTLYEEDNVFYYKDTSGMAHDTGFKVDRVFKTGNGFHAYGLVSEDGKHAYLVVRGTTDVLDIFSDMDPRGFGYGQFEAGYSSVARWLDEKAADDYKLTLTGHSLGGTLCQWIASQYLYENSTRKLSNVTTYNATGISREAAARFNTRRGNCTVTHHIVNGDIVSMAGDAFIIGTNIYYSFGEYWLLGRHIAPLTTDVAWFGTTPYTKPKKITTEIISTEDLNSFWFHHSDWHYYATVAGAAALETAARDKIYGSNNNENAKSFPIYASSLVFRGTTESFREKAGSKLTEYINVDENGTWTGQYTFELPDFEFKSWGLRDSAITVSASTNGVLGIAGTTTFDLGNIEVTGSMGFQNFQLDTLSVKLENERPMPIGSLPVGLKSVKGEVANLNSDSNPLEFTGTVALSSLLTMNVSIPKFLNQNGEQEQKMELSAFTIEGEVFCSTEDFKVTGTAKGFCVDNQSEQKDDFAFVTAEGIFDFYWGESGWKDNVITFTGMLSTPFATSQSSMEIRFNEHIQLTLERVSNAFVPESWPFIGGMQLMNIHETLCVNFDDNPRNDFYSVYGFCDLPLFGRRQVGFTYTFDRTRSFAENLRLLGTEETTRDDLKELQNGASLPILYSTAASPLTLLPTSETNAGTLALVSLSWEEELEGTEVYLVLQNGIRIHESGFSQCGIEVFNGTSGTEKILCVDVLGFDFDNWTFEIVKNGAKIDCEITEKWYLHVPDAAELELNEITQNPNGKFVLSGAFPNASGETYINIYLDDDNTGFDGHFVTQIPLEDFENGTVAWESIGIAPGTYYLYASTMDSAHIPTTMYFPNAIEIEEVPTINGYHSEDYAQLLSFLEQTDENGVKNGTKLNSAYDAGNTATWSGITWKDVNGAKRIYEITWNNISIPTAKKLVGTLDLSSCEKLTYLDCSCNALTSLDVSKNTALLGLSCSGNNLTSLDVSKNTALTRLDCFSNPELDYIRVSPNAIGTLEINAGSKWTFTNETGKQLGNGIWRLSTLPVTAASPDGSQSIYISSEPIVQLEAPSFNALDAGTNYAVVNIGNIANASGYTLQYSTNSSFTNAQTKTFPVSGEHTISGLMADTNYFFRVKANGSGGHTDSEWTEMQLWTKKPLEKEAGSLIVNTTMDVVDAYDGVTSIREAISFAKEGETVTFDESMRDQTIVLNGTQLSLTKAVSLDAGDLNVTIDADGKFRVLWSETYSKTAFYLKGLTFTETYGAGIYHREGVLTVTNCVIQNNQGDGIHSWTNNSLTVESSAVLKNSGEGLLFLQDKKLNVSNSLFAGNTVTGICVFQNNVPTLTNSTVVGNGFYGVIANSSSKGGLAFTVNNSIVTANGVILEHADMEAYDLNGKAKVTNSIVGTNDPVNRDTLKNTQTGVRDPGFVNLPDFANYEEWLNAREEDWDLTLKAGSRAINAGDVKLLTKSGMPQTSSDLAGNARISGSKVDIGAYEYQTAFIETPDVEVVKSGKTLTVTWDAVYGASSYLVEYRDVKTAKWTAKTVKKGTSLAINGKVGTTYEIRVTAVTANGNSKAAVETVTVYAPLTTPKLKALKDFCKDDTFAVEVTNYAANLASAAESVTFGMNGIYETFTIENGSGNVRFASGEVVTFQNGTFTVTNAKANSQYKLEVMFSNPLTGSAFAKANVKTTKTTYLAPTNFRVTASTSNSITLDWSDSTAKTDAWKYAEKYTVQYSTNGGKSWRSVSVKTSEATLTRLKSGTYLIRVLAAKDSKFEASLPTEILEFRL